MITILKRLRRDNSGATVVEYGLIVGLIFLAAVVAIQNFSNETVNMYNGIINAIVAVL